MGSIDDLPRDYSHDTLTLLLPIAPRPDRIKRFQDKFSGLKVEWHSTTTEAGVSLALNDLPEDVCKQTTFLCSFTQLPAAEEAPDIKFVQLTSAGAEHCTSNSLYHKDEVPFCTANGVHPPQIAEWVIGSWLSHQHQFSRYAGHMQQGYWEPPYKSEIDDSTGLRMCVSNPSVSR